MPELVEVISPFIKEDADVEAVKTALEGVVAAQAESYTTDLAKNRDQILAEKRALKSEYDEYRGKYGWLDEQEDFNQEKFQDMMSEIDTLKSNANATMDEITQKLDEKYQAGKSAAAATYDPKLNALELERKSLAEERDKYKTQFQDFMVENKLRASLSQMGIQPSQFWFNGFKNAAKASFNENGLDEISVSYNGNQIPLSDWVNVFPNSEEGKKMIPAGMNTGGGARGGASGAGGARTIQEIGEIKDPVARQKALDKYMGFND